jgi:hypothetical protein
MNRPDERQDEIHLVASTVAPLAKRGNRRAVTGWRRTEGGRQRVGGRMLARRPLSASRPTSTFRLSAAAVSVHNRRFSPLPPSAAHEEWQKSTVRSYSHGPLCANAVLSPRQHAL